MCMCVFRYWWKVQRLNQQCINAAFQEKKYDGVTVCCQPGLAIYHAVPDMVLRSCPKLLGDH